MRPAAVQRAALVSDVSPPELIGAILTGDLDGVYLAAELLYTLTGEYLVPSDIPLVDLGSADRTGDGVVNVGDFALFLPGVLAGRPGPSEPAFTGHVRKRHGVDPGGLGFGTSSDGLGR